MSPDFLASELVPNDLVSDCDEIHAGTSRGNTGDREEAVGAEHLVHAVYSALLKFNYIFILQFHCSAQQHAADNAFRCRCVPAVSCSATA